jgi:predicted RecB family nuclease
VTLKNQKKSELLSLKNVGPATLKDLSLLGITTIKQLANADPSQLYAHLEKITGIHHDPCVWDVFAAIIHQSQTGEGLDWWTFTPIRKENGVLLCSHPQSK